MITKKLSDFANRTLNSNRLAPWDARLGVVRAALFLSTGRIATYVLLNNRNGVATFGNYFLNTNKSHEQKCRIVTLLPKDPAPNRYEKKFNVIKQNALFITSFVNVI